LLDENGLGEEIGGVGLSPHRIGDEGFGLPVTRPIRLAADSIEEIGEHLAFFGGH